MIFFKDYWKNVLDRQRIRIIEVLNQIVKSSDKKTEENISHYFDDLLFKLLKHKYDFEQEKLIEVVEENNEVKK